MNQPCGGSFVMGSPPVEPERLEREGPQHRVTLSDFYLGRYPVTQAQWRFVAGLPLVYRELNPDPAQFKGDDRPVEMISWFDALEFCDRLSQYTGRHYRLPTEAEWEYACRAGTTTPFHFGETLSSELANYGSSATYNGGPQGDCIDATTPVRHFAVSNRFGLCDMHGNVYDWCQDQWHDRYDGAPTDGSAWEDEEIEALVKGLVRGGAWNEPPRDCRSADRYLYESHSSSNYVGFRVACSAPRGLA